MKTVNEQLQEFNDSLEAAIDRNDKAEIKRILKTDSFKKLELNIANAGLLGAYDELKDQANYPLGKKSKFAK